MWTTCGLAGPFYASVGYATSDDDGLTFTKHGIVGTSPYRKDMFDCIGGQGLAAYSVIEAGDYLYMFYRIMSPNLTTYPISGIGLARASKSEPGVWMKYYRGGFTEPGIGGNFTPVIPLGGINGGIVNPNVVWNSYLKKFLMINVNRQNTGAFYLRTSNDLIDWTAPQLLVALPAKWRYHYPSQLDETKEMDQSGWLYSARFPSTSSIGPDNILVRRSMSFELPGYVDDVAPTVSLTSPVSNATVSGTVTLKAIADDNIAVSRVNFYADGKLIATTTTFPYVAEWNTTSIIRNSVHVLTVRAYDWTYNIGRSTAVTVTVAQTAPLAASIPSPVNNADASRSAQNVSIGTRSSPSSTSPVTVRVRTSEQIQLNLQLVTDGLMAPSDLVFAPDGSILVAERGGEMRIIRSGALLPEAALDLSSQISLPGGGLLAVALDPKFERNRLAYVLYASGASDQRLAFTLARFRLVGDTFGERAVLLDRIPASPTGAAGMVRVGADGNLYVALDDAASARAAGDLGSFNGKILRLNLDATTPEDQAGATPVYSIDHPLPKAFDWQPSSGELWVVDGLQQTAGRLSGVMAEPGREKRASVRSQYDIPAGTGASSATFYRGMLMPFFRDNLFIAAEAGRHLLRIRFDPQNPERIVTVERLLQNQIGAVRVVAEGPDGAVYICNDTQLWRLAP